MRPYPQAGALIRTSEAMTRERDPFRIPRAGWEAAPAAGIASVDINFNGGSFGQAEIVAESSLGGLVVYGLYQALLTGLRSEAMRRQGLISRPTQIRLILDTAVASMRQGALTSVTLAVLLLVFPWLAAPLSLLGIVGLGKASFDLFHSFWDGLSPAQQQELLLQARQAGVDLARFLGHGPGAAAA